MLAQSTLDRSATIQTIVSFMSPSIAGRSSSLWVSTNSLLCQVQRRIATTDDMSGSGQADDIEEELYCPICADLFNQPLMLPCTHSFCKPCLHERLQKGHVTRKSTTLTFDCPVCRDEVTLGENGLDGLPGNRLLRRIVDKHRQSLNDSLSLSSTSDGQLELCEDHRKELGAFCFQCKEPVCIECIVGDHKGHGLESVDDSYFKRKRGLAKRISDLEEVIKRLEEAEADERGYLEQLEEQCKEKMEAIEIQFDEYIGLLKQSKESVLGELVARQQEEVAKVNSVIAEIETKRNDLSSILTSLNDSVNLSRISLLRDSKSGLDGSDPTEVEALRSPRTRCFLDCTLQIDSVVLESAINSAHLAWEPEEGMFSPKHLANSFTQLYEREWKSAYLESTSKNKDELVTRLYCIVMDAFRQAEQCCESHLDGLTYHMLQPDIDVAVGAYNIHGFNKEATDSEETLEFSSMKEALRKLRAQHSRDFYQENLAFMIHHEMTQLSQGGTQRQLSIYANKCFQVCFMLMIQDPPLYVQIPPRAEPSGEPDRAFFKNVKRRGKKTKTIAWPPLFLYKDGPLLAKGICFVPG